jgi:hypothetical protein
VENPAPLQEVYEAPASQVREAALKALHDLKRRLEGDEK